MNNEFTFQSVGHGLFYTGRLLDGKFNFVYDCGGNKDPLKKAIDNYIKNAEDIDFLVVSHLDRDHICGVYDLWTKLGEKIKKIYLPYLGRDESVIKLTIANFLLTISERDDNELLGIFRLWVSLYMGGISGISTEIIAQGNEVICPSPENGQPYWYFKMFNKNIPVIDINKIEEKIKKKLDIKKIEEYLLNTEGRQTLRNIYEEHCSSVNNSSTILIHYPANNSFIPENCGCCLHNKLLNEHPIITILTGDAEFDKDMLFEMQDIVNNIPNQENGIKIFQVPHHGGLGNWDSMESEKFSFDFYVISFRYGDEKHPNNKVLSELTLKRKSIRFATQLEECFYKIECVNDSKKKLYEQLAEVYFKGANYAYENACKNKDADYRRHIPFHLIQLNSYFVMVVYHELGIDISFLEKIGSYIENYKYIPILFMQFFSAELKEFIDYCKASEKPEFVAKAEEIWQKFLEQFDNESEKSEFVTKAEEIQQKSLEPFDNDDDDKIDVIIKKYNKKSLKNKIRMKHRAMNKAYLPGEVSRKAKNYIEKLETP